MQPIIVLVVAESVPLTLGRDPPTAGSGARRLEQQAALLGASGHPARAGRGGDRRDRHGLASTGEATAAISDGAGVHHTRNELAGTVCHVSLAPSSTPGRSWSRSTPRWRGGTPPRTPRWPRPPCAGQLRQHEANAEAEVGIRPAPLRRGLGGAAQGGHRQEDYSARRSVPGSAGRRGTWPERGGPAHDASVSRTRRNVEFPVPQSVAAALTHGSNGLDSPPRGGADLRAHSAIDAKVDSRDAQM